MRARTLGLCLVVVVAVAMPAILTGPAAAGVAPSLIAQYLGRMSVEWKVEDKDLGFRYVFTTEDGLGYDSFRVSVTELLRIADTVMVPLYAKYR